MFQTIRNQLILLAMFVVYSGCTATYYTKPLQTPHLNVAQAGLAPRYDVMFQLKDDQGNLLMNKPMARINLTKSGEDSVTMTYEVTDPEMRKEAEKKGEHVIDSTRFSLVQVGGKTFMENEVKDPKTGQIVYMLSLFKRLDDKGTIALTLMDLTSGAGDDVKYTPQGDSGTYLFDNSKLSTEETLARLSPSMGTLDMLVLVPRN